MLSVYPLYLWIILIGLIMRILFIGDIIGEDGCRYICDRLPSVKRENKIDAVIANGENSANGNGITTKSANLLLSAGVDCITTGNHAFQRGNCDEVFEHSNIIRPLNFKDAPYGNGSYLIDFGKNAGKDCALLPQAA